MRDEDQPAKDGARRVTPPNRSSTGRAVPDRASRLARVDARLTETVPDASGGRAHGADLRARLAATDRDGRFRTRLAQVQTREERRRQRGRVLRVVGAVSALLAIGVVALIVGTLAGDDRWGLAAGVVLLAASLIGQRVTATLAARRGAEAWDWQAGRHRLLGRPAKRVQDLDRPDVARGPLDPRA